jgi:hypothetical protein
MGREPQWIGGDYYRRPRVWLGVNEGWRPHPVSNVSPLHFPRQPDQQEEMSSVSARSVPSPYDACILACRKCMVACESVLATVGDSYPPAWAQAVNLCTASIRSCEVALAELNLGSAVVPQTCALCAVLCRACAEECAQLPGPWTWVAVSCQHAAKECHAVALGNTES